MNKTVRAKELIDEEINRHELRINLLKALDGFDSAQSKKILHQIIEQINLQPEVVTFRLPEPFIIGAEK